MTNSIPIMLMVRELGIGGCERDLTKLAKSLVRSRFAPHVGCFHSEGLRSAELRAAGIPIVRFAVRSFLYPSAFWQALQMVRYVRENKIQVVHCFDVPTVVFGVPTAYFGGVPAIVSAQLGVRELFSTIYHRVLRVTDHMSDVVVANSAYIQQYLVRRERIPAHRTYLCYNGVELDVFKADGTHLKPSSIADAALVIGTICALRPEKRVDLLLRAFAQIRHLLPGIKLLIVGSGPVLPQLEALHTELGIENDCVFEPSQTDVAPWMRALDIYVMCSESESFPNALLEAMACGCAVIGSQVGGIPELIDDGVSGLLFESKSVNSLSEAIKKMILDPDLRRDLGAKAAARARDHFSMALNLERNTQLYLELLGAKGLDLAVG